MQDNYVLWSGARIRIRAVAAFFYVKNEIDDDYDAPFDNSILEDYYKKSEQFLEACIYLCDNLPDTSNEVEITKFCYDAGKPYYGESKENMRLWFKHLYQILFNTNSGPRMGAFLAIVGIDFFRNLLIERLKDPMRNI